MDVRCDKCQTRYRVDDGRIGPRGLMLRCGKCQNTFKVFRPAPANGTPAPSPARLQVSMPFVAPPPAPATPAAAAPEEEPPPVPPARRSPSPAEPAGATAPAPRGEPRSAASARPDRPQEAPRRAARVGLAATLAVLLLGGAIAGYGLLERPSRAARALLTSAQADAEQDTLASLSAAEAKARDALRAAGTRAHFPQGTATLAAIELQWADALNDQAARLRDRDGAAAAGLRAEARTRTQSAFDMLLSAWKADRESPDLQLALADYYRTQRSRADMIRYLANVPGDARASLIQGMADAQEEGGAQRAIPRLRAALSASPRSARVHYRLALAYAALEDAAGARSQLQQTLELSPLHERAQALLDELGAASARGPK